jgi:hypothetical protein
MKINCFSIKSFTLALTLGLSYASGPSLVAAEISTPAAISLAGTFSGRWLGQNEMGGDLRFKFSPGTDAPWTAEVLFVYEGTDVHAQTQSVQINGNKVEVVIAWEIQGTAASTTLTGMLSGQAIEGTYKSTAAEEPATGKWKVTRG